MDNYENQEINAGSMADIAFLLLIFFLVTTTMDQDSGIRRTLPYIDNTITKKAIERNVYEVKINDADELLVENEFMEIDELRNGAIEFFTNSGVFNDSFEDPNLPKRRWVNLDSLRYKITQTKFLLDHDSSNDLLHQKLKILSAKLDAVTFFGEYKELPIAAIINLQNHNGTSYGMYIQVQNELTAALHQLRDELTFKKINKSYLSLSKKDPYERKIIKAVRQIYPQRISENEPKN